MTARRLGCLGIKKECLLGSGKAGSPFSCTHTQIGFGEKNTPVMVSWSGLNTMRLSVP